LRQLLKIPCKYKFNKAVALEDTSFLVFTAPVFKMIFTSYKRNCLKDDFRLALLKKVSYFNHFPDILINKLINSCKVIKFR